MNLLQHILSWFSPPKHYKDPEPAPSGRIVDSKSADGGSTPPAGANRFDKALEYVLLNEGPFSNDPRDPGGATKFGIIKTEYEAYLGRVLTVEEVRDMPLSTARAIYKKKFWNMIRGDEYTHDSVATVIFDTAVNKGLTGCLNCIAMAQTRQLILPMSIPYNDMVIAVVNSFGETTFREHFSAAVLRYNEARVKKYPAMMWAKKGWDARAKRLATLERNE